MSKQQRKTTTPAPVATTPALGIPAFFANTGMQSVLFFLLSLLLYANTLGHGFVLDDFMVIKKNTFTQQGFAGLPGILSRDSFWGFFDAMKEDPKQMLVTGGRYRPLSLVVFALIWQFFGENPFVFHVVTVLAYAATSVLLYHLLLLMIQPRFGTAYAQVFAWIASLLFICHPLHTEVVANIKGCDEILALAGGLATMFCAFKAYDTGLKKWWIGATIAFFLGCMSKENAATFIVVIPLALWFFRDAAAEKGGPQIGTGRLVLGMLAAFGVFFVLRGQALDWAFSNEAPFEPMNNPFIKIEGGNWVPFTPAEKLATVFVTLGKYLLLLIVPHPLTHDYYPRQLGIMSFGDASALLSLAAYVALFTYAIWGIRRRDIVRFSILYYLLTLSIVSNLVFSVGTLMNERFLFMPSVGFCMAAAALLLALAKVLNANTLRLPLALAVLVAVLFSFQTILRNPVWVSNEVLFVHDVNISKNSAKAHDDAGGVLFNQANIEKDEAKKTALLQRAIGHFDTAIGMHPRYHHALMHRAASYYLLKNYEQSVAEYRTAFQYFADNPKVIEALALSLRDYGRSLGNQKNDPEGAYRALAESWQLNPKDAQTAWLIGVSYAKQSQFAQAVEWFDRAVIAKPDNAGYVYDLGTAYFRSGNLTKGQAYYAKAKAINPDIAKSRGGQ